MECERTALRSALIVLVLLSLPPAVAVAQAIQTGPQVLTFFSNVDDSDQPYALYVPRHFDPAKAYPLVVSLHGAGSNHRLNLRRVFGKSNQPGETDVEATRTFPEWRDVEYLVVSPLARGTMGYDGIAEKDVRDVLADVKKRFRVDDDRVYLTGLSMGGGGTLWLGLTRPDLWAAIAPVCPAAPEEAHELAGNALNLPVKLFQGASDPVVRPADSREWNKQLSTLGTRVEYVEYRGVGHESWEPAYKDGAIFNWFSEFRRDRYPDRVRFATRRHKYNKAYWIRVDELVPGKLGTIDAKLAGANHVDVAATDIGVFTLLLKGHPKFSNAGPVVVSIDGQTIEAKAADSLTLCKRDGKWAFGALNRPALAKQPGTEGPLAEAVAARHVYVYGTADNPSADELTRRRDLATQAADWSVRPNASAPPGSFFTQFRAPLVYFRVLADRDVRPSDLSESNLILFGTKETNSLIARFSDRLPIHLNPTAKNHGLVYLFPVADRYVLVSSGIPWWTSKRNEAPALGTVSTGWWSRPRYRFLNSPSSVLDDFKDFLLFNELPQYPVAEGFFDNRWRLVSADAEKLKKSGVVTISEPRSPVALKAEDIVGTWNLKYTTPIGQTDEPVLVVSVDKGMLKGAYTNGDETFEVRNLRLEDDELTFQISGLNTGSGFTLTYRGKPRGNAIEGRTQYQYKKFTGSFRFQGKRSAAKTQK